MNKIKRLSSIMKYAFYILTMIFPLLVIAYWFAPITFHSFGIRLGIPDGTEILHTLSWQEKGLGFLVSLIPNLLILTVFYYLAKLFALYEHGKIFVLSSSNYLKKVGILLLINGFISPFIFYPLTQVIITIHNPAGHRYAAITLGTPNLYYIFVSLLIILISWIMAEACKIYEEQQLTV